MVDISLPTGCVVSLGIFYRSPNSTSENNLQMLTCIKDFSDTTGSKMLILGDFNLPRIDWSTLSAPVGSYEELFVEVIMENFLIQHVTEITRARNTGDGSMLDLVFSKDEEFINQIEFGPHLGKSDHLIIKIKVNELTEDTEIEPEVKFQYYKGDYRTMNCRLANYQWSDLFQDREIQECWNLFKTILLELQNELVPKTEVGKKNKPPWMNKDVVEAIRKKKGLWKKYLFCRTLDKFSQYKIARNKLKSVTIEARRNFEMKIATEVKDKPKSFWNYVGRKVKPVANLQQVRNGDGELTNTNEETAMCLNAYFVSVFSEDDGSSGRSTDFTDLILNPLKDVNIEERSIIMLLKDLKVDKAMGPDGLCPRILHETREQIAEPIKMLFDKSLTQGQLPSDWKDAIVVPIFKKGRRDMTQNYRPVSLTCVICKILEKFIRDVLLDHLMKNRLISEKQFGFVPGRSCTLQLLRCVESWTKSLDEGTQVDVIYTDYSKAFDRVSHSKLLKKLDGLGVRGYILGWIQNFLCGRRQKVKVHSSYSEWALVKSGVPQGSVLGPVLFMIFINDLPDAIQGTTINLFADDAKLDQTIKTESDVNVLQESLTSMISWSDDWGLKLNAGKCKVLHISRNPNPIKSAYVVSGEETLEDVSYEKDLGVYVVVNTANKITGIIYRNFKMMGDEVFTNLYKTLVRPHLEYSSVVWSPLTVRDQKRIEAVQRRATRLVSNISDMTYEGRLRKLGIPTLQYRRSRADMIQVYKIIHGIDRISIPEFFEIVCESKTRGHQYKIAKKRSSTSMRKHTFSNRVVEEWNSLPEYVVDAPNTNVFKSRLNSAWKNHPYKFQPSFY